MFMSITDEVDQKDVVDIEHYLQKALTGTGLFYCRFVFTSMLTNIISKVKQVNLFAYIQV